MDHKHGCRIKIWSTFCRLGLGPTIRYWNPRLQLKVRVKIQSLDLTKYRRNVFTKDILEALPPYFWFCLLGFWSDLGWIRWCRWSRALVSKLSTKSDNFKTSQQPERSVQSINSKNEFSKHHEKIMGWRTYFNNQSLYWTTAHATLRSTARAYIPALNGGVLRHGW